MPEISSPKAGGSADFWGEPLPRLWALKLRENERIGTKKIIVQTRNFNGIERAKVTG